VRSKAILLVTVLYAVCCLTAIGQEGEGRGGGGGGARGQAPQAQQPPAMDKVTPEIKGLIAAGTKMEIVKYGLRGDDGGVGMPDGSLLITTNGGLAKVDNGGNLTMLLDNSDQAAGLAMDSKGRVIAAQYSKKVSVIYPKGSEMLLTDNYEGKPFIRPNDLVVDKKGGVYFTDCYQVGGKKSPDDLPQAVYYIPPGGKIMRVIDDISRPNGITLSPNQKTLFVNDWDGPYLVAYDIQPDGTLKNRKNFGKFDTKQETDHGLVSGADGLCSDSKGNMYSTTPAGVQVFNSKGEHLANLEMPYDMPPQNCGFAGPDKKDLFIVGRGIVVRIHTMVEGPKDRAK
jgi:gluconolactonase